MKTTTVRGHTRTNKKGKLIPVRQHGRTIGFMKRDFYEKVMKPSPRKPAKKQKDIFKGMLVDKIVTDKQGNIKVIKVQR